MDKLDEISRKRKKAHQKLVSLKSKVYEHFLQMEQAAYADGALPKEDQGVDRHRHLRGDGLRVMYAVAY